MSNGSLALMLHNTKDWSSFKLIIMNGSLQLCSSGICVKATGDFAEALLLILGISLIIAFIVALFN